MKQKTSLKKLASSRLSPKSIKIGGWVLLSLLLFHVINRLIVYLADIDYPINLLAFPSFKKTEFFLSLGGVLIALLMIQIKREERKKQFRYGEEHGSAKWGGKEDRKPFNDPNPSNNILLSKTERMTMSPYSLEGFKKSTARNKNVLVIGGSGSGKTRFYVTPNLMQMHSHYVVTDPKGALYDDMKHLLKHPPNGKPPYRVISFNTIDMKKSARYNPFVYIKTEQDIGNFVEVLISNTKGEGEKGDDFWVKSERLLYCSYIAFLIVTNNGSRHVTFKKLLDMVTDSEVLNEDKQKDNSVDFRFNCLKYVLKKREEYRNNKELLEQDFPDGEYPDFYHWGTETVELAEYAISRYKAYKLAAGKTAKSILISCAVRLNPFSIKQVTLLTETDELLLESFTIDWRTALFVIISDTNPTFNFLVAILYSQLFQLLVETADSYPDHKLPLHCRFILDEFANIGTIPRFEKLIATIRSREISASIILQTYSQLKSMYKDDVETIAGNCDTLLFLGGKEQSTLEMVSKTIGKQTIAYQTSSDSRGTSRSMSQNNNITGRELITQDELARMDGEKCIVLIRGARPFMSDKYNLESHKYYKLLSAKPKPKGGKKKKNAKSTTILNRIKL